MKLFRLAFVIGAFLIVSMSRTGAQLPVITSFSQNGVLVCTNLELGTVASVEWAAAVTGPWTNNWAGLAAPPVSSNGTISVSVPMFYRVRGMAAWTNTIPTNMALIPAGSFTMGDAFSDNPRGSETPTHSVYVSAFYMDKYEVTKALWDEVYNWAITHGYSFDYADSGQGKASTHPAQSMTWYDAVKWCNARSERDGLTPAYYTDAGLATRYGSGQVSPYVNWSAGGYRLPTEAEWEKGTRGGSIGQRFPWGNTINQSQANYYSSWLGDSWPVFPYDVNASSGYHPSYNDNVTPYTSPVGSFGASGYGLYDMAGNVWEWCWDWYGSYDSGSQTDPRGPASGSNRVGRGGAWSSTAIVCRAAFHSNSDPAGRADLIGFRCARAAGQ